MLTVVQCENLEKGIARIDSQGTAGYKPYPENSRRTGRERCEYSYPLQPLNRSRAHAIAVEGGCFSQSIVIGQCKHRRRVDYTWTVPMHSS